MSEQKLDALQNLISTFPSAVLAFSGGVDSTLLAVIAHRILGNRFLAVTAASPVHPESELVAAKELAAQFGFRHQVIFTQEFAEAHFIRNPPERCYFCKLTLFRELKSISEEENFSVLLAGDNYDDLADYRPGHRAAREMNVRSPLQEVGLSKTEIREWSRRENLPTWCKPAYACLASRIPYGRAITVEALARIDQTESFLLSLGFLEIRVRDHFPVARLEFGKAELERAWNLRELIAATVHKFGFPYVAIDLDGFRSGSMNTVLPDTLMG
ncbi:ATP-dependent sacrificial sulfur transferase LarE [Syntrophus buswellii]|jgi:uncharacterized protein|uniref:ATP-dependent sacrificial sulfur transferase LarE n=1 Tax=Syntrophus buswellii TaxID=43774 RepID=UPI0038D5093A